MKFIALSLNTILVENSTYAVSNLRKRILKEKLLEYKCQICRLDGLWQSLPLSLQLDHINGVSNDHRIDNLRFLCPNCHSQTATFAGKNNKIYLKDNDETNIESIIEYNPQVSFKQKKNFIWKLPNSKLKSVVASSNTFSFILRHFGLPEKGAQYKALKERLFWENINFSHIKTGKSHNKGRKFSRERLPLESVLIVNSKYSRYLLKERLLTEKLINNSCSICGLLPIWNNQKLILQLDHINGTPNDNRINNLRLLCYNCHSQTKTYAGKKR